MDCNVLSGPSDLRTPSQFAEINSESVGICGSLREWIVVDLEGVVHPHSMTEQVRHVNDNLIPRPLTALRKQCNSR